MKIQHAHWNVSLAILLLLALIVPAQAGRFKHYANYQAATFQLSGAAQIAVGSNPSGSLLDLRHGEHVTVTYDQENGTLVAHRITAAVVHNPKPLASGPKPSGHHQSGRAESGYWSVHGVIASVNAQAGTLTIVYKRQ